MMRRLSLIMLAALLLSYLMLACGERIGPDGSGGRFPFLGGRTTLPENPVGDRENPLLTYIRDNWTGGDTTSTGGLHYGHIKLFGLNWTDLSKRTDPDDQAEFVVDHFDMYVWGGGIVGDHAYPQYPSFLWMHPTPAIPFVTAGWDSMETANWLADSTMNTEGCTWYDLVMHFKYNNRNVYGWFPGWNPDDDFDGDGCIEPGEGNGGQPSDSMRSAQCAADAEVITPMLNPSRDWYRAKVMSDCYIDMVSDRTAEDFNYAPSTFKGSFLDSAPFEVPFDFGLDSTFTYEGLGGQQESNLQYYFDKLFFVPSFTVELEDKIDETTIVMANTVMPLYTCATEYLSCAKEWMLEYLENFQDECWLTTNSSSSQAMRKDRVEDWLDCPYLDYMESGKGYVFCTIDPYPDDRGKLFSLATFYMINHQMAFYYYKTGENEYVWDWQWNPYVEFDVGQPAVNSLGLPDFQGNYLTNLYFVWEETTDYVILGREYLRDDDKRVLVLTKIMAYGKTEGADETAHCLPGFYKRVLSDLSLGDPTDEVSLVNNEGVILVEDPTFSIPFTNIEWSDNPLACTVTISWNTPDVECKGKAVLYSNKYCLTYYSTKYESQYSESHSLTFDVDGGQYYSVKIYAKTPCSDWEAEGNCYNHRMGRCIAPPK